MPPAAARLTHLILYASAVCNARCVMCDVGRESDVGIARPLDGAPKFMDTALLERLLDDPLVAGQDVRINTYFVMTEPLLTPHLPELLAAAHGRGHPVYLTTNGLLLERRAAEIAPYLHTIQVSIDGPEEVHDAIRGPGFFRAAMAGLKAVRELRPDVEVVVNTTIFNRTAPRLIELAEILDAQGVAIDLFKVQGLDFVSEPMRGRHNAACPDIPQSASTEGEALDFAAIDFDALAGDLAALRQWHPRNIRSVGFKPPFSSAEELRRYYSEGGEPMERWRNCGTPWTAMAVNTAGDCFFHTRCFNDYVLGNATDMPLVEIFHGQAADHLRQRLAAHHGCFPACTRCCGVNPLERVEVSA